jgi:hypothetical protein
MTDEKLSRFKGVRLGPTELKILDEMKRHDYCERSSHGIRKALREFATNHGLVIEEDEVPA